MAFTAPTLTTSLSPTGYAAELDSNLSSIQTAFNNLQTLLTGDAFAASPFNYVINFQHLTRLSDDGGVVGEKAFAISFDTSEENLTISHSGLGASSNAVFTERASGGVGGVGGFPRWYTSDTAYTTSLTSLTGGVDGTYNIIVGLRSVGSPSITYVVAVGDTASTDYESLNIDLPLYSFSYTRSGGGSTYNVTNLRRECDVSVAHDSFKRVYDAEVPMTINIQDPLAWSAGTKEMNTDGYIPTVGGFIIPWDCEVSKAYVYCENINLKAPTDGYQFDLFEGGYQVGTSAPNIMQSIFGYPITLKDSGTTVAMTAATPPRQVAAGTFIQPAIGPSEGILPTDPPTGLTITLLLKRRDLGIYT